MKKGIAAGAGIMGLSNIGCAEAVSMAKLKTPDNNKAKGNIVIESTKKIYTSEGKERQYNHTTNMDFWHGKYYVVFRQAIHHMGSQNGRIVLLESSDLENWTSSILFDLPGDDRDPKLFSTPDRLFVYATTNVADFTVVTYTDNGTKWNKPKKVPGMDGFSFWKPKVQNGVYYCAADNLSKSYLLKSTDGINWQRVSVITNQNVPSETAIVYLEDGRCIAFMRQNVEMTLPGFAIAGPPYTSWDYKFDRTGPVLFSGHAAERFGDTIVVASRAMLGKKPGYWDYPLDPTFSPADTGQRTVLYTFDVETMSLKLKPENILPTERGGDSSYVGIVSTGPDTAVLCWHDGHVIYHQPNPSDIWMARIKIT